MIARVSHFHYIPSWMSVCNNQLNSNHLSCVVSEACETERHYCWLHINNKNYSFTFIDYKFYTWCHVILFEDAEWKQEWLFYYFIISLPSFRTIRKIQPLQDKVFMFCGICQKKLCKNNLWDFKASWMNSLICLCVCIKHRLIMYFYNIYCDFRNLWSYRI